MAKQNAVASARREVRRVCADALTKIKGVLRTVYRPLELPGKNPSRTPRFVTVVVQAFSLPWQPERLHHNAKRRATSH